MGTRSDQFYLYFLYQCFVFYLYNKLLLLVCKLMILIYFFTSVQCLKRIHHCKYENMCIYKKVTVISWIFIKGIVLGARPLKDPNMCLMGFSVFCILVIWLCTCTVQFENWQYRKIWWHGLSQYLFTVLRKLRSSFYVGLILFSHWVIVIKYYNLCKIDSLLLLYMKIKLFKVNENEQERL